MQLHFFRLRFTFEAADPVCFPPGASANAIRGALGSLLRRINCACRCAEAQHDAECLYARIFEPRGLGPSGFAARPRPFVLRTHHLDGRSFSLGENFSFDIHLFDRDKAVTSGFIHALSQLAGEGIGAGRGSARLESVEQLPLAGEGRVLVWNGSHLDRLPEPCTINLTIPLPPATTARVRFVTPTELKSHGSAAARPDFPVLFARLRDRLSALSTFYGPAPLDIDFRGMGERATRVEMTRCELQDQHETRRSTRTGQFHPLGGFTGEADYRGDLAEFLPYIQAARWTGVGRQTVWGKGEVHLVEGMPSN